MGNKGLIIVFLLAVSAIVLFAKATSNKGELSCMVIERPTIKDWNGVEMKEIYNPKAFINGEEIQYDAASYTRCDEVYKYFHLIGYGNIEGSNEMVYLYRLNLQDRFVTVPELLAIYNDKHRHP